MPDGRHCPECGNQDIEPDTEVKDIAGNAIRDPHKWICKKCGYDGYMPEAVEEGLNEDEGNSSDLPLLRKSTMHYRIFLAAMFILMFLIMVSNIQ